MATDENNHKNEARDDWTGCTFRVERGPSSEGRAWRAWRRASRSRPKTLSIYQLPACLRCLSAVRGLIVTR